MDKLRAMQIFSRVVESHSFAGAAKTLGVPRSTISRSIQELEATLGVRLLQRTTRTLNLTPNGSLYYDHCQRILGDIAGIEAALSDSTIKPRGLLRVDMTSSFARVVVLPGLRDFQARYPEIDLSLTLGDRPVELVEEGVDCVVRTGTPASSALLVARHIGSFDWITCAAPDYLARCGTPDSLGELAGHEIVGYRWAGTGRPADWRFTVDGVEHTIAAGSRLVVNDTDTYLDCGLEGLGLIRIGSYLATPHLATGRRVRVLRTYRAPPEPLWLIYPQDRHLASKVRAFADWLGERVRTLQPEWQPA